MATHSLKPDQPDPLLALPPSAPSDHDAGVGGRRGPIGTFLFVPMSEFRSWFLMAFAMVFLLSLLNLTGNLPTPPVRKPSLAVDSAPLVLFGMFAFWLSVSAVRLTLASSIRLFPIQGVRSRA